MRAAPSVPSRYSVRSRIVIDASAFVELLLQTTVGVRVDQAVGDAELIAPDVLNPEVLHTLRGLERGGKLTSARASEAVERLVQETIVRVPTAGLLHEAWSIRANVSAYDACYVALARLFDCPLLTTDRPLTSAPDLGIPLIVV
jgi:predicted nucleic acid-binding protein